MKRSKLTFLLLLLLAIIIASVFVLLNKEKTKDTASTIKNTVSEKDSVASEWKAPDIKTIPSTDEGAMILYGRDLMATTSKYFGPKGTVAAITNGMNCQNCHLDAGAKSYGNSFAAVAATYPMLRNRSGIVESIEFRINDCLQRSLNGKTIDSNSKEMRAMVAYLKWIGKDVAPKLKPKGAGIVEIPFLKRAADTAKGRIVYMKTCITCHGPQGKGLYNKDSSGYTYPPLWGKHSYNTGAGLYRISRFAAYVKYNMPFEKASHQSPQLTDEEAWDVAAFVNSQPRPVKFFKQDWPDLSKKAVDYPYGPFADTFSAAQHKYGPFEPIAKLRKK
jgi:thiosulfate dehydrogenase